jgi:hypothetical protein
MVFLNGTLGWQQKKVGGTGKRSQHVDENLPWTTRVWYSHVELFQFVFTEKSLYSRVGAHESTHSFLNRDYSSIDMPSLLLRQNCG